MKRKQTARPLAFLTTSLWLAVGCTSTPSPPASPAVAEAPLPARRATLSLQASFTPELTHQLALDGVPVEGSVQLQLVQGTEHTDLDEPIRYLFPEPVLLEARGGKVVVPSATSAVMARGERFELVIADRRYSYPRTGATHPFRCAQALEAMRALEACVDPLPSGALAPEVCDGTGVAAWLSAHDQLEAQRRACWLRLDEPTLALLDRIKVPEVRAEACEPLVALAGPVVPDAIGLRLLPHCRRQMPAELAKRLLRLRRLGEIDEAFKQAAASPNARQMQLFHARYAITGDPRVEQVRALAIERFGPPDPARFIAARRAVEALGGNGYAATLCSASTTSAEIAVLSSPPRHFTPVRDDDLWSAAPRQSDAGRACFSVDSPRQWRKPPPSLGPAAARLARALLGLKSVTVSSRCTGTEYWFLEGPLPPLASLRARPHPPAPPPAAPARPHR